MSQSSLESASSALTLTPAKPEILYFAYASPSASLLALSPSSVPVGLAYLPGFALALNPSGRANLAPVKQEDSTQLLAVPGKECPQSQADGEVTKDWDGVYGLLYLAPEEDEPLLDAAYGSYKKAIQEVQLFPTDFFKSGESATRVQVVRALVYLDLDVETGDPGKPADEHVKEVNDAVEEAVAWGMPQWYAERAKKLVSRGREEGSGETKAAGKRRAVG